MSTAAKYDVVVIGGGIAGLSAANRAAQLGLSACVLEQGSAERYLCNTRYTGGTLHVCLRDIMSDAAELRAAIDTATEGATAAPLADVIAGEGRRVVRWLQSEGIRFMKASPAAYHNWVMAPPRPARPGLEWEGRGGDVLLRTLGAALEKRGGKLMRNARARKLVMREGRCSGVQADIAGDAVTLEAAAVVIADGGFQGNPDLVRAHISPRPESVRRRGAATGAGDGLLMAREAGAQLSALDAFYGHLLSRDAMHNDKLWPYPTLDSVVAAGLAVDAEGRRFADEGCGGVYMANAVARRADPLGTWAILDAAIWNGAGKKDLIPANPHVQDCGGTVLQAASLEALAGLANLPAAALIDTVRAYNEAVERGATAALAPPRHVDKYAAQPIHTPPFFALPLCAGMTYTMGGIAVDQNASVLSTRGGAIEGLYAAGSCVGGIDGGPRAGYVGGLVKAGVLGLRAAEHLARAMGKSVA